MVNVTLPRSDILYRAVTRLTDMTLQNHSVTIIFNNTDGMTLLAASPPAYNIIALLRIHRESFTPCSVIDDFSGSVELDELCRTLSLSVDQNMLGIYSIHDIDRTYIDTLAFRYLARTTYYHPLRRFIPGLRWEVELMDVYATNDELMEFYETPRPYVVRIAIPTPIFLDTLSYLSDAKVDTVYVLIRDTMVTFTAANKKMVLSLERNEYVMEGVVEEDQSPCIAILSLTYLNHFEETYGETESVWIYPSLPGSGGLRDALSCSVYHIGEITYFFRDESGDDDDDVLSSPA